MLTQLSPSTWWIDLDKIAALTTHERPDGALAYRVIIDGKNILINKTIAKSITDALQKRTVAPVMEEPKHPAFAARG